MASSSAARSSLTLILYYRILGANIGANMWLHSTAVIAEPDLVSLGNDVMGPLSYNCCLLDDRLSLCRQCS